jgi:hypothetical protein
MEEWVKCVQCSLIFPRDSSEKWKKTCFNCYKWNKQETGDWGKGASSGERVVYVHLRSEVEDEVKGHLFELLQLCHPDKHAGSALANKATQWLNDLRKRKHW